MGKINLDNTVKYSYKTYGDSRLEALLIMPSWNLFNNNQWSMIIDYLKNYFYVITFSPKSNDNEEKIEKEAIFYPNKIVEKATYILDNLKIKKVNIIGFHTSCAYALLLANKYPNIVLKIALINNPYKLSEESIHYDYRINFQRYTNWKKWINKNYDIDNYAKGKHFFKLVLNEFALHSSKNDLIACSKISHMNFIKKTTNNEFELPKVNAFELVKNLKCKVHLIHGFFDDSCVSANFKQICALKENFRYTVIKNAGHMPHFFSPVEVNCILYDFFKKPLFINNKIAKCSKNRKYKALYIPSPIGLGHVQRDLALARELRSQKNISVEWLIPSGPARKVLEDAGEIINPYSNKLQSILPKMTSHVENHEMNFFENWRNSESLRVANFMIFLEAIKDTKYDLWIGDEAWDVDYYLHKNPKLKTSPYVFLTDFIGWIPINTTSDSYENQLTHIYNFEMTQLIEENKTIRDKALYIGHFFDIVDKTFGNGLEKISDWAKKNFNEVGYLYSPNSSENENVFKLYEDLGLRLDQKFIIITVGGTVAGKSLIDKVIKAWSIVVKKRPDLYCVIVSGPSIELDISDFRIPNLIIKKYIENLHKYFSIAELAVVQGGLGTTMELAIRKKPFLYFPLKNHCEQMYHVKHRLKKYKSGIALDWDSTSEFTLAKYILENLNMDTRNYFDHDANNVNKAAKLILSVI